MQFFRDMSHNGADSPNLGGIMPSGYHIKFSLKALMVNLMGHLARYIQINVFIKGLQSPFCHAAGNNGAAFIFFFPKGVDAQGRAVRKGDFFYRLINGKRLRENSLITDFFAVVFAKRLNALKPQKLRQTGVISHLWVLIQRQVYRVQADIVIQQKFNPPPVVSGQSQGRSPKKPVVDKEHTRVQRRRPFKGFQAGVHAKSDFAYFAAVIIDLDTVHGIIRAGETLNIEKTPEKGIKFRAGVFAAHIWEYIGNGDDMQVEGTREWGSGTREWFF